MIDVWLQIAAMQSAAFYIRNCKIVKNVYLPFNDCFFTLEFPGCFFLKNS